MSVSTTLRWSVSEGKISPSELESIDARSEKRKRKKKHRLTSLEETSEWRSRA